MGSVTALTAWRRPPAGRVSVFASALFIVLSSLPGHAAPQNETARPLVLGVHPYLPATELVKRFTPLAEYLGGRLGREVTVSVSKDYQTHIGQVARGEVDIAYMGPASYAKVAITKGIALPLVRLEVQGRPAFKGFIVTRRASALKALSDLNGRSFAFGDPNSTMSHLVPRYMLIRAGITVDKFKAHQFLGSHRNVALAVLAGDFDAGAVKEEVFYEYRDRGLRVLAATPELSEHLFVCSGRSDKRTSARIRAALLDLKDFEGGPAIIRGIKKTATGLVPALDEDYETLRGILSFLKSRNIPQRTISRNTAKRNIPK